MDRRLEIDINGEKYFIRTDLPQEYIESLIDHLNKYTEKYPQYKELDRRKRALLASVNILNDYWQYRIRNLFRIRKVIDKLDNYLYYENNSNSNDDESKHKNRKNNTPL